MSSLLFLALAACGGSTATFSEPAPKSSGQPPPDINAPIAAAPPHCSGNPTVTADIGDQATANVICSSSSLPCEVCVQTLDAGQPSRWLVVQGPDSVCSCESITGIATAPPACSGNPTVTADIGDLALAQAICRTSNEPCEICVQELVSGQPAQWMVFEGSDSSCPCPTPMQH
jgi:hypothetical protein